MTNLMKAALLAALVTFGAVGVGVAQTNTQPPVAKVYKCTSCTTQTKDIDTCTACCTSQHASSCYNSCASKSTCYSTCISKCTATF
jgi:hypothetical protein